jgi:hypothetical protein
MVLKGDASEARTDAAMLTQLSHVMTTDRNTTTAIVPLPRRELLPGEAWSKEIVTRAFELWAFCRNAAATARMLENELHEAGHEGPTPSARTIRRWVEYHGWRRDADELWREHRDRDLFELQAQASAAFRIGLTNVLLAAAGAFEPAEAAVRLKAFELTSRLYERGIVPLAPQPPAAEVDESQLSRREREGRAMERMAQRRRERS